MKLPSKLITTLILFSFSLTPLYARDVILLENLASAAEGEMVLSILQKKFNIPRKLITLKNKTSCQKNSEAIMQLCLQTNGELEIIRMNKYVVEETLGAFLQAEE